MFPLCNRVEITGTRTKYYFKLLKHIFDGKYQLEHVTHCYCGSTDLELLSIQDRFGLPFGTKICRACGLIQLSPRLCAQFLPSFYEEIYWGLILGESDCELATGNQYTGRRICEYLQRHIIEKLKRELVIVEIGCGSGINLEEIKKSFEKSGFQISVHGCDFSEDAVRMARERNIEVHKGGIDSLQGIRADIVILSHVVEHFVDIKGEFDKIKELLEKEGYLYIEVPGVCDLMNKREYDYNYLIYSVLAHIHNFNLLSLRSVIEPLGFKFIAGDEYVRSIFQYHPSHTANLDVSGNYLHILECIKQAERRRKIEDERRKKAIRYKVKTLLSRFARCA